MEILIFGDGIIKESNIIKDFGISNDRIMEILILGDGIIKESIILVDFFNWMERTFGILDDRKWRFSF